MRGRSFLTIPLSDAALDPSVDFLLDPANSASAKLYAARKLARLLKAGDM
jgi:hypothetical protein